MKLEYVLPNDIEKRSFEIIESELGSRKIPEDIKPIVMRVIHTSADFNYYDNLCFSGNAVETALRIIKKGIDYGHRCAVYSCKRKKGREEGDG